MKINERSQLALRFMNDTNGVVAVLRTMQTGLQKSVEAAEKRVSEIDAELNIIGRDIVGWDGVKMDPSILDVDDDNWFGLPMNKGLSSEQSDQAFRNWLLPEKTRWFLIQPSALEAAKRVRVSENYTARSLKDIGIGNYCYMLGPNSFATFRVEVGKLWGQYLNTQSECFFYYTADLEGGGMKKNLPLFDDEYTQLVQLLTYIELADTEITIVEPNGTNGKTRAEGKLKNDSDLRVHVVDSSWNQIIIRDKDFLVRGHFRLQPCGPEFRDRKLIWIDSFSKHGYKRSAPVTIIRT